MPNRYNDGGNSPDYRNYSKHIKNTDNESTQYFSANSDSENTAEIRRPANRTDRDYVSRYDNSTPGRRQYYSSDEVKYDQYGQPQYSGQQSRQYDQCGHSQYSGQQSRQYDQYGQPQYSGQQSRQYDQYGQPQYSGQQSRQYDQYGQPRYSGQQNRQYDQYGGAPRQNRPRQQGQPVSKGNQGSRPRQASPGGKRPPNGAPQKRRTQNPPPQQPPRKRTTAPKPHKRKKHRFLLKIFITLLLLVGIIFGVYSCTAISLIKKLNYVEDEGRNHTAGALSKSYVTSVLLIGTDGRTADDRGRSDTMILMSINKKNDEITLTSFMRDSYVEIPGYGWEKLNASYSYGGPELLMDTIEKNFSLRVDDYVAVNFNSFASIIDAVGGIEIDVSNEEAQEINTILMAEVNELMGDAVDSDLLSQGGKLLLNGKQALSYARIRYIGNADFERTERQRAVLTQVANKLKSFSPSIISKIAQKAVPQITTNMTTSELYLLSLRLPFVIRYDIEQLRVPAEGTYGNVTTDSGGSALSVDFEANYNLIKEEVFGE